MISNEKTIHQSLNEVDEYRQPYVAIRKHIPYNYCNAIKGLRHGKYESIYLAKLTD